MLCSPSAMLTPSFYLSLPSPKGISKGLDSVSDSKDITYQNLPLLASLAKSLPRHPRGKTQGRSGQMQQISATEWEWEKTCRSRTGVSCVFPPHTRSGTGWKGWMYNRSSSWAMPRKPQTHYCWREARADGEALKASTMTPAGNFLS